MVVETALPKHLEVQFANGMIFPKCPTRNLFLSLPRFCPAYISVSECHISSKRLSFSGFLLVVSKIESKVNGPSQTPLCKQVSVRFISNLPLIAERLNC